LIWIFLRNQVCRGSGGATSKWSLSFRANTAMQHDPATNTQIRDLAKASSSHIDYKNYTRHCRAQVRFTPMATTVPFNLKPTPLVIAGLDPVIQENTIFI